MTAPLTTPERARGQQTIVRVEDHHVKLAAGAHRYSAGNVTDADKLYSDLQEAWLRDWGVTIVVLGNTYRIAPGAFVPARREASYRHGEHAARANGLTAAIEAAHETVFEQVTGEKPKHSVHVRPTSNLTPAMRRALETIDDHGGAYVTGRGFAGVEPGTVRNGISRLTANRLLRTGLVEWEKVPVNERRLPRIIQRTTTNETQEV